MEVNKDKLLEVLKNIDKRLSTIENHLGINKTNPVVTKNTNKDNSTKIPKNTIDWDNLIYAISDTNTKNLVNQIYQNQYPTITQGQYTMIQNIADRLHINVDL